MPVVKISIENKIGNYFSFSFSASVMWDNAMMIWKPQETRVVVIKCY